MANPGADPAPLAAGEVGRRMAALFGRATVRAAAEAHAEGLAVPGRVDGGAVEQRPDGTVHSIDETARWSPTGWRAKNPASS